MRELVSDKEEKKKKSKARKKRISPVAPAFSVLVRIEFPAPKVPTKRREVYLSNGPSEPRPRPRRGTESARRSDLLKQGEMRFASFSVCLISLSCTRPFALPL